MEWTFRSPSGDIDILTLFVAHDFRDTEVFIDNGSGKSRKIIEVTSSQLSADKKHLLEYMPFLQMTMCYCFCRNGKDWSFVSTSRFLKDLRSLYVFFLWFFKEIDNQLCTQEYLLDQI